jgi:hypothetical protein
MEMNDNKENQNDNEELKFEDVQPIYCINNQSLSFTNTTTNQNNKTKILKDCKEGTIKLSLKFNIKIDTPDLIDWVQ